MEYLSENYQTLHREVVERFRKLLDELVHNKVLEIACGTIMLFGRDILRCAAENGLGTASELKEAEELIKCMEPSHLADASFPAFDSAIQNKSAVSALLKNYLVKLCSSHRARLALDGKNLTEWLQPTCPSCGSLPSLSRYAKESGKRILYCGHCVMEWEFARLQCPFCGNEEQRDLFYFEVEDQPWYRIDCCRRCHASLRAVDERKRADATETDLLLEEAFTLHLDRIAKPNVKPEIYS
ncbi:MAG: formate dehydrogenase accessory protein FdhE [Elusimicrobiota bacterium]